MTSDRSDVKRRRRRTEHDTNDDIFYHVVRRTNAICRWHHDTYQTQVDEETGVFARLGQVRQEDGDAEHQDELVVTQLLQRLKHPNHAQSVAFAAH